MQNIGPMHYHTNAKLISEPEMDPENIGLCCPAEGCEEILQNPEQLIAHFRTCLHIPASWRPAFYVNTWRPTSYEGTKD